jgi:hypothetical protein
VFEAKALLNAIAPSRTASGVGSAPTLMVAVMAGAAGVVTFTTLTVLPSEFST